MEDPRHLALDAAGDIYISDRGQSQQVKVFSPAGKHLGTIKPPEVPANLHWGDADAKTLYITARTGLYRIKLNIAGIRPVTIGS